jgi:UDP-glucose 4-epimerase
VAAFLARGHQVRALVRPAAQVEKLRWPESVEIFRADLRAAADLLPAFEASPSGGPIDCLVHLAAAVTGSEESQFVAGVVGTERLLEAMARSQTRHLVLASSFSVYDWSEIDRRLSDDSLLESDLYTRDGYAIAKFWQERITRRYAERNGWDLTVLRPGFIWGPGNAYLACLGQKAGPVHLVFSPTARLPLTYVENCADAFVTATADTRARGHTYNVLDGYSVRTWGYLGRYLRASSVGGWRIPIPYLLAYGATHIAQSLSRAIFRKYGGKLPSILVPCRFEARFKPLTYETSGLQRDLGWRPPVALAEALRRTYEAPARAGDAAAA